MLPDPNLFLSLGKPVKDEYGRFVGEIASFAVKPNGIVDSVYIRQSDGQFTKYPATNIRIEGSEVIFLSTIKMETTNFCDKIPLIWRKDQALNELLEKKKISPEVYEDLHNSFEGALNQLKSEAQTLIEKIEKEMERCSQEIRELNYALVHLEVEHEIGEIDDQSYQTSLSTIQECLKRANTEKSDLANMKNKLSNILLGETLNKPVPNVSAALKPTASLSPLLPEPPVIVYVKEAGESHI